MTIKSLLQTSCWDSNGAQYEDDDAELSFTTIHIMGREYGCTNGVLSLTPIDNKQQQEAFEIFEAWTIANGNVLSHVDMYRPERVLDASRGFGHWALEFIDYLDPKASIGDIQVEAISTQNTFPQETHPSCEFYTHQFNKTGELPYGDNYFDYIHIRMLDGMIKDVPLFLDEVYRILRPCGFFEWGEIVFNKATLDAPTWYNFETMLEMNSGRFLINEMAPLLRANNWGISEIIDFSLPGHVFAKDTEGRILQTGCVLELSRNDITTLSVMMTEEALLGGKDFFIGQTIIAQKPW